MKRVLCGRTPWSTKKNQMSADDWIDRWISEHGYESGNDMYGYPMIWQCDGDRVSSAHKLEDYDGLYDEVQEALENSRSEKKFKEELDDLIDDHLGFVSDNEIAEMEGNNPFDDDVDDDEYYDDEEDIASQEDSILYLDDYSEDEIQQLTCHTLAKNKTKVYYHDVMYQYDNLDDIMILDVNTNNVIIDIPIVDRYTNIILGESLNKHMKSMTTNLPRAIDKMGIYQVDCQILDLSNLQCRYIQIGTLSYTNFTNTQVVKLPKKSSYGHPKIRFSEEAFMNSTIQTISNSESIGTIGHNCFQNCKNLKSLTLNSECFIAPHAFKNSSLEFIDWSTDQVGLDVVKFMFRKYGDSSDVEYMMSNPFEGTPYQAEFIEEYVKPFLEDMNK